jgi:preprotein translocase subunit Sec61beta
MITMPKESKKGSGFQSAAGLIRYFDSEDEKAIKINPYFVIAFAVALIFIVEVAKVIWNY